MIYFLPCRGEKCDEHRSIFKIYIKLIIRTCAAVSEKWKSFTWRGSPLCRDANFPPHQSHAVNWLPSHPWAPFWLLPLPQAPPLAVLLYMWRHARQTTSSTHWNPSMSNTLAFPKPYLLQPSQKVPCNCDDGFLKTTICKSDKKTYIQFLEQSVLGICFA